GSKTRLPVSERRIRGQLFGGPQTVATPFYSLHGPLLFLHFESSAPATFGRNFLQFWRFYRCLLFAAEKLRRFYRCLLFAAKKLR
uniref:Uncharacterized protein n=1 Tax=Romanomermis culicivorax TaxID=13658 RepID=A0A915JGQ0_ROMCU